ncbi:MAG: hypothetical protein ACO1SV_05985 [Fimbriimonas sp.]
MKTILRPFLAAVALCGFASAQTPLEQGTSFFQNAWKRVQSEGPAAAERLVRATPERFKKVKARVGELSKLTADWADEKRLEERKNLVMELWRVRGSLDLMSLLNPDVLEQLTGIDGKTLRHLRAQTEKAQAMLRLK